MKHFQQGEHQPAITLERWRKSHFDLSQGCMIPKELLFWKVCRLFFLGVFGDRLASFSWYGLNLNCSVSELQWPTLV